MSHRWKLLLNKLTQSSSLKMLEEIHVHLVAEIFNSFLKASKSAFLLEQVN